MSHLSIARLRRWSVVLAVALTTAVAVPAQALAGGAPGSTPTITSPADGSAASTSPLTVTASSTAPEVRFTLDSGGTVDTQLVPVSTGTATADLALFGVKGNVTVRAVDCSAGICNTSEDTITVDVGLAAPVITSPVNNKVVGSSVTVKATAPGGALQFLLDGNVMSTDLSAPFEKPVSLDGKSQGNHTITVKQCNVTGDICQGDTDAVTVIKDTQGPKWSDLGVSTSPFYPVNDGYKDTTNLSAKVGEKSSETKVEIRKQGGPVVRTIKLGRVDQGRVKVTWNGKKSNGDIVPAGKYTFRFVGTDVNGVVGKSNDKVVQVSGKKLVKKTVTKTVSAWGSKISKYAGSCSSVVKVGSGTVGLRSNSKDNCTGDASIAATQHAIKIGKAKKYGNLKISVYGEGVTKDAPTAIMYNVRKNGETGGVTRIGGSKGWTAGDSVDLEKYLFDGGYVSWVILTGGGNSYNAIKFKVQYTVTVLQ
jgi:flagellar hook assembly protein FlgD